MSQFFTSGGQSIGASASASVLPMNIQDWFPLGLISLISLQPKGLSTVFCNSLLQPHSLKLWKRFLSLVSWQLWNYPGASYVVLVVKNLPANAGDVRDVGSIPGLGRSPGREKWHPTAVFLPGKSQRRRSLADYSPWDCKIIGHDWGSEHVIKYLGLQNLSQSKYQRSQIICDEKMDVC